MIKFLCMQHLAIMKKEWGLLPKILSGEKKIESRWYKNKYAPWGRIKKGELVFFKNSGELVTVRAKVAKIIKYAELNPQKVRVILNKYGKSDGLIRSELPKYFGMFKDKKYCLLVFLKDVERIKPFDVDKTGFGAMSAWICVKSINQIKQ